MTDIERTMKWCERRDKLAQIESNLIKLIKQINECKNDLNDLMSILKEGN
jgi:hypothetical protein